MSDMRIQGPGAVGIPAAMGKKDGGKVGGFDEVLDKAIGTISQIQKDTETAAKELAKGGDVTSALIAMERADMSFQLMVEVRNRLLNAYEEIMRMPV